MPIFSKNSDLNMLRTIIIDDEAHIRQMLERTVNQFCPNIKLVGMADGVKTGMEVIRKHKPDLLLLDIELKDGTGFDLLKNLQPVNFKVIFITAYNQYAVKAFRFSAIDYLLKPIDPEELQEAVQKAEKLMQQDFNTQLDFLEENMEKGDKADKKIIFRTQDNIYLVRVSDINYCGSDGGYTTIHLVNGNQIVVSTGLKDYEDLLREFGFYRIHKSYLINMRHISRFEKAEGGYIILQNEAKIPVATRKREELLELFNRIGK